MDEDVDAKAWGTQLQNTSMRDHVSKTTTMYYIYLATKVYLPFKSKNFFEVMFRMVVYPMYRLTFSFMRRLEPLGCSVIKQ